jgi:glycosyltransferase involved in cell wall biosynthesis
MTNNTLSALIIAHNEEDNLDACLNCLKFADEIVVVLDKCTDGSKEIALKHTNNIIEGSWNIEGKRRNIGLKNCSSEWILEIDADERVSPDLAKEIITAININQPCRFIVPINNYIGTRYVKYGWIRTLAVLKRATIHYKGYKEYDEDKEVHPTAKVKGELKHLSNSIQHLMDKDLSDTIVRFNRYTSWRANDMIFSKKIKGNLLTNILSGFIRFFKAFIFKKGYKEGRVGFFIALLGGLYPIISYLKAKEK